jgi:hypothetical protein
MQQVVGYVNLYVGKILINVFHIDTLFDQKYLNTYETVIQPLM